MSTVAADAGAAPVRGGRKKLILIIAAAVLLLAVAGVAVLLLLKPKPVDDEDGFADDDRAAAVQAERPDPKKAPTYVPLEPFTVNLADRESDRYAQIAVTLELAEPETADAIKAFMPAIRNNILMTLAHKTARELMERDGKERLAQQIRLDTARGLGMSVADEAVDAESPRGKRRPSAPLPVSAVYFSTFIVQ